MIYGLYLSASGVLSNSHRQDVIANNLANSETVGFKRDLAISREQRTESAGRGLNAARHSNRMLEVLGGGHRPHATRTDFAQGEFEGTGNPLDVAVQGKGYFALRDGSETRLTRDGRFSINSAGYLVSATNGREVMDDRGRSIQFAGQGKAQVASDGTVTQEGALVGRIGLYDVPSPERLRKRGEGMLACPASMQPTPIDGTVRSEFVERANVEPATELTAMMDAQRQIEANANLIRYQDQTLGRLVNDVGKIG
jgi:flagellar basal-body rod protein FlgF